MPNDRLAGLLRCSKRLSSSAATVLSIHVVWFRNDLRTTDHQPLCAAIQAAERDRGGVLPVYVVDPHWFGKTSLGYYRIGAFRSRFLKESIADLQHQIESLGSRMAILVGSTESVFANLLQTLPIASIHWNQEFAPEEKRIEQSIDSLAADRSVMTKSFCTNTLLDIDELPFAVEETPEVFTKFRRIVEKKCDEAPPMDRPASIAPLEDNCWTKINDHPLDQIDLFDHPPIEPDQRAVIHFTGGETNGRKRLQDYLWNTDAIATYKETRNGMNQRDDSSKFSAWLAHGCLSARTIAAEVRRYERERTANDSTYWMIFELLWRDYFALMMAKHGAKLFHSSGLRGVKIQWDNNASLIEAWQNGNTGFPLVDANMRELKMTGYMSNRGRQNVGSFLVKNLGVDWRHGAQWFESLLTDYDASSNYGNWNYVAGVGNDAREFRWFNIIKQSQNYDPDGDYVRKWCPELAHLPTRWIHQPWRVDVDIQKQCQCLIGKDYPAPVVDLFESADLNRVRYERATN